MLAGALRVEYCTRFDGQCTEPVATSLPKVSPYPTSLACIISTYASGREDTPRAARCRQMPYLRGGNMLVSVVPSDCQSRGQASNSRRNGTAAPHRTVPSTPRQPVSMARMGFSVTTPPSAAIGGGAGADSPRRRYAFGAVAKDIARGLTVQHDWGSRYTSHAFGGISL